MARKISLGNVNFHRKTGPVFSEFSIVFSFPELTVGKACYSVTRVAYLGVAREVMSKTSSRCVRELLPLHRSNNKAELSEINFSTGAVQVLRSLVACPFEL